SFVRAGRDCWMPAAAALAFFDVPGSGEDVVRKMPAGDLKSGGPLAPFTVEQREPGHTLKPCLVDDPNGTALVRAGHRGQARHRVFRQPLFWADPRFGMVACPCRLEVEFARVDVVIATVIGAVDDPHVAVFLRRDGAADEVFLRSGHDERLAPLAGAVIA